MGYIEKQFRYLLKPFFRALLCVATHQLFFLVAAGGCKCEGRVVTDGGTLSEPVEKYLIGPLARLAMTFIAV